MIIFVELFSQKLPFLLKFHPPHLYCQFHQLYVFSQKKMYETILRAGFLIPSTIMMRKSIIEAEGHFDNSFRRLQDRELWIRLLKKGFRFIGKSEVLVRYRIHSDSLSTDPNSGQQAVIALALKHFGPDDGQPQTWSCDKRRVYGGVYRYHVLTSVHSNGDWQGASDYLRKALQIDPTLSTDIDLYYDLAHGNQPPGSRRSLRRVRHTVPAANRSGVPLARGRITSTMPVATESDEGSSAPRSRVVDHRAPVRGR